MKVRTAVAALTTGIAMLAAGTATASPAAPALQTVVEGPQGVVWSGACPAWIDEDKVDTLSEPCRSFGFRDQSAYVSKLAELGGTSVTKSLAGQVATSSRIEGATLKHTYNPGPWWPEVPYAEFALTKPAHVSCTIAANGTIDGEACSSDRVIDIAAVRAQAAAQAVARSKGKAATVAKAARKTSSAARRTSGARIAAKARR